jgi:hypothetical protein
MLAEDFSQESRRNFPKSGDSVFVGFWIKIYEVV